MRLRDRALLYAAGLVLCPAAGFAQLTAIGSQVWQQGDTGILGSAEPDDGFGEVTAVADFDCDGFDDLVVGIPHEDVNFGGTNFGSAGAVQIFYGGKAGVATSGADEILTEADTTNEDPETSDHFGWAVAAYTSGDTCPDGSIRPRLAVGAPDEDYGGHNDAGVVFLFRFRANLGHFEYVRDLVQGDINVAEDESGDQFGSALAAIVMPDLVECVAGADNAPGLAVGAPGEDDNPVTSSDAGAVFVFRPRFCATGTVFEWETDLCESLNASTIDCIVFRQGADGLDGTQEEGDRFGETLSGRKSKRLIIGVPGENSSAGLVQVIYDGVSGLSDEIFDQDNLSNGASESGDGFGSALAEGDFDGDGDIDLAVGVPGEDVNSNSVASGGAVAVIRASGMDLTHTGDLLITQDSFQTSEDLDQFGSSLAAGDFDNNDRDDLAIGVPHEDTGSTEDTGEIHVVYGSASGLDVATFQTFTQNTTNVPSSSEECDEWGYALAAGDFDGALGADLAVGAPGENGVCLSISGAPPIPNNNEGAVFVLYGGLPGGFLSQLTVTAPSTVGENAGNGSFTVHRTGSAVIAAGVHYDATAGSALPVGDFSSTSGDLSWAAGNTTNKTVQVPIVNDVNGEPDEDFFLELSTPGSGVQILDAVTEMTIVDDDTFVSFADDFDGAFPDLWTSTLDVGNAFDQSALFPYFGDESLRVRLDDTLAAVVRDDRPFSATYHARFYLRLVGLDMQPGDALTVFTGLTASGDRAFTLTVLGGAPDTYSLVAEIFNDTNGSAGTQTVSFPLGYHAVEMAWGASTNPGTPNGFLSVKIDGTTDISLNGANNDTVRVDRAQLGATGVDAGTTGEFWLDQFASFATLNPGQVAVFSDVGKADAMWNFTTSMYNFEITRGCDDDRTHFCKLDPISREELALLLMRARRGPASTFSGCTSAPFTDVATNNVFCKFIKPFKDEGITAGCGGGNYCPKNAVRRGELAVLLLRAVDGGGATPAPCATKPFTDIETTDPRCPFIQEIKTRGISLGCGGANFCPDEPVRRQELAILVQRAFGYRLAVLP